MSCCCVLRNFILVNANASVLWIFYILKNQTCMNIFPGHIWVFHSNGNAEISFIYFSTLLMHTFPHFSTLLMHTWGLHRDENIDWGARVIEMESPPNIHISNIHTYLFSHTYIHIQYTHPHMIWYVYTSTHDMSCIIYTHLTYTYTLIFTHIHSHIHISHPTYETGRAVVGLDWRWILAKISKVAAMDDKYPADDEEDSWFWWSWSNHLPNNFIQCAFQ